MFFDSLESFGRVALAAIFAYAGLVLVLRISGKRSLAKLNAFDFVVTVAFGSTLATILLSRDVPLADGLLAFAMLASLQYVVSRTSLHWPFFKHLVRSEPRLLVEDGVLRKEAMQRERVTQSEIEAAIRKSGIGRVEEVAALVIETDGNFSVIKADGERPLSALRSVER